MPSLSSRRNALKAVGALGAAALWGHSPASRAEPAPEVKRIRLAHTPAICLAPQYLAEELLKAEGFEQVEYVDLIAGSTPDLLAQGGADISMWDIPGTIPALEEGKAVVMLAGVHAGCYELFGNGNVRSIRDLKGKTIPRFGVGGGSYMLLASILAYVGINPRTDVNWVNVATPRDATLLFAEGKADAFMGFPPEPQELRARKVGRVILNTTQDRPWSQYFCCCVNGNRDFVRRYPVATKKVLRSILKAADLCATRPEQVARYLKERGFEPRLEVGLEVMKSLPYRRWRHDSVEDTLRFNALRLYEVGLLKVPPEKLIAQGTDWRIFHELRRELKA